VVLLSAVLCIVLLMLPLSTDDVNDSSSILARYCVVSVHQKLIAAYILGLYRSLSVVMIKMT